MSEYNIKLEVFEGPLALLMHLIEKNKLDIYDIPIAEITEQYLDYLNKMEKFDIEIASSFLVMAATLLQIKSRMLLPKPVIESDSIEEEDPRQELVDRLLEYRRFKLVSELLAEKGQERERVFTRQPQEFATEFKLPAGLKIDDLIMAFAALWESTIDDITLINREEISIQDKMADIINLLHKSNGKLEFSQTLIRTGTRTEVVAAFLALLELIRMQRVIIEQQHSFGPIQLRLRER